MASLQLCFFPGCATVRLRDPHCLILPKRALLDEADARAQAYSANLIIVEF
jgi:hypothetical protein